MRLLTGDRTLAWRSVGEGPPLLLVNGYAAAAADWDPGFLDGLARRFEVLCPDNRGMGDSELGDLSDPITIGGMAADLLALLDERAIARLPVAGWSMGGFVAQTLACRAPARVSGLALLATDPGGPAAVPADPGVWAQLTSHAGTPREQASRLIGLLFPPGPAAEIDAAFGDAVAAARAEVSAAALSAQEAAMASWHGQSPPVPAPALPVLVAHGTEDRVIPVANATALAARWTGARVELFHGCGHAFMAQDPRRLSTLISEFLT